MLTNFRTMTVDRCHNRFVALFWFRCFVAQVASRLTSPQLEDVHERSTVHALAAGATCVTRHTSHVTRHTSHVTRHASHGTSNGCQEATSCSQRGARDRLPVQHTRRRWARRLGRAAAKLPVAMQSPESTVRGRGATATRSDGGQTDPIRKNPTGIDDGHSALTVQQTLRRRCCCCCCCCCCC